MRPNQSAEMQLCDVLDVEDEDLGEEVVESWQPNQPGDLQVVDMGLEVTLGVTIELVKWDEDDTVEVVVTVGTGAGVTIPLVMVDVSVVVDTSLQPNQPGEMHVVRVVVTVVVTGTVILVDSSRHPHQPGVLQVSVRVRVVDVLVDEALLVVSVPLLSKNFHS
jgi:hypothetical protein